MVRVTIANSSKETGALLVGLLKDAGIYHPGAKATVCYGSDVETKPNLNAQCGLDKITRMNLMKKAGVSTVPWFSGTKIPANTQYPLLARKASGFGGTDIIPVFQPDEVKWRVAAGWDWFSSYVPVKRELRVWIFRGIHLDTYEKTMQRPTDFKYIGRNFRNGFDFSPADKHEGAFKEANKALRCLGLDFGAVDLLIGQDDKVYILEVNTAPGVIKSKSKPTLVKLAEHIVKWDSQGHPDNDQ